MGGGWGGHGARMGAWSGHVAAWNGGRMAAWKGRPGNWNRFHHGHFVHRHGRVFFVGGPWWGGYYLLWLLAVGPDSMGSATDLGLQQLLLGKHAESC